MNDKVKTKLNDQPQPIKKITTTALPPKPHGPEPYANSYFSFSGSYLKDDFFDFNATKSLLKITRQNNKRFNKFSDHSLLSIKLYRNVVFIINLSNNDIFLDDLIYFPVVTNSNLGSNGKYSPQMPLHIFYDSSKSLSEYVDLDAPNSEPFYVLKAKNSLILEY
jgi:hypothetical protein